MIIDKILDRKDGKKYEFDTFFNSIRPYAVDIDRYDIINAFGMGTEKEIQKVLCDYVLSNNYNPTICDYIKSVKWII